MNRKIKGIVAIVLIISYFLPWGGTYSGIVVINSLLSKAIANFSSIGGAWGLIAILLIGYALVLLLHYVIIIMCGMLAVKTFKQQDSNRLNKNLRWLVFFLLVTDFTVAMAIAPLPLITGNGGLSFGYFIYYAANILFIILPVKKKEA